eukprot:EG_transcript_18174
MDPNGIARAWRRIRNEPGNLKSVIFFVFCSFFVAVTLATAAISHSLALLALSFHFLHHVLKDIVTLFSGSINTSWAAREYSYGYRRVEVLVNYALDVLLGFTSFAVGMEAIHRAFHTDEIDCSWIPLVCLISILFLSYSVYNHGQQGTRRRRQDVWKALFLATTPSWLTLTSAAVILQTDCQRTDSMFACVIGLFSFRQALSTAKLSSAMLLQKAPEKVLPSLERSVGEVSALPAVDSCDEVHFWTLSEGIIVGSIKLNICADATEQGVLRQVRQYFEPLVSFFTVQVEKKDG